MHYVSLPTLQTNPLLSSKGDLAFKKTYPALFGLFRNNFLPRNIQIVGYARSALDLNEFKRRVSSRIKFHSEKEKDLLPAFLEKCTYVSGKYDESDSYEKLRAFVENVEGVVHGDRHRIFYMALPPSVFGVAAKGLKEHLYTTKGTNRLIVEKPFGKDTQSSNDLSVFGKILEGRRNLSFANVFFESVWDRSHINNVQITFKEPIGTEGRGGYFDEFGIIRDWLWRSLHLSAEDVRDEKVKVLRAIQPLTVDDMILGQYTKSADGREPGYLDDPTVPQGSVTPTFAAGAFYIKNERWEGVPFILKCGKALDEQKTEIRIQFKDVANNLYSDIARNELVIRVQPREAVYMKFMNKQPGLGNAATVSELDMTYNKRYSEIKIPDAYESLILDALKGDKSNFVRDDELDAAWKIFTPVLHAIEEGKMKSEPYTFGTRGPVHLSRFVETHGYTRSLGYSWGSSKM
ncbi:glucose-6-phosphate dehydrogenase [Batrachochytrium salamandrivorans]|nr:glucose-6-phosphate dehydrogenase [Batrachochytrium salamandrivorans]